jgi:hypothetical protein
MQSLWLPAIEAQLALNRKNPAEAISDLQAASSIELGTVAFGEGNSCLYHTYIRGDAYLASGQGTAAAAEFQRILDHSGIVLNCWTGALVHLGVVRMRWKRELPKGRKPTPHAFGLSPLTKTSSPSGKTPTPTSQS